MPPTTFRYKEAGRQSASPSRCSGPRGGGYRSRSQCCAVQHMTDRRVPAAGSDGEEPASAATSGITRRGFSTSRRRGGCVCSIRCSQCKINKRSVQHCCGSRHHGCDKRKPGPKPGSKRAAPDDRVQGHPKRRLVTVSGGRDPPQLYFHSLPIDSLIFFYF